MTYHEGIEQAVNQRNFFSLSTEGVDKRAFLLGSSFRRKPESSLFKYFWTPAFAGVTFGKALSTASYRNGNMTDNKPEVRQNKVTGEWVVFAPTRRKRPSDFRSLDGKTEELPSYDPTCPFCPGNERQLAETLLTLPEGNGSEWRTKVVANKFPALDPEGDTRRRVQGIHLSMGGFGRHEVIIESPAHNRRIASLAPGDVELVIETYSRRYTDLMKQHETMMAIIFRNHGRRAGTSLIHPHSQIVVTGVVPRSVRRREEEAGRYFDNFGSCVFCDLLDQELKEGKRMVYENRTFAAFIPFAAEVPFEVWIVPRRHQADFGQISDEEKADLAHALHHVLGKLTDRLNDPDYNYVINTSARFRSDEPQLHWYLQILPRLTTRAGFEIGSGISINPSLPEADAEFLTDVPSRGER